MRSRKDVRKKKHVKDLWTTAVLRQSDCSYTRLRTYTTEDVIDAVCHGRFNCCCHKEVWDGIIQASWTVLSHILSQDIILGNCDAQLSPFSQIFGLNRGFLLMNYCRIFHIQALGKVLKENSLNLWLN